MGLLDDAIREHLELKRRHGADAGELARLEAEALRTAEEPSASAPEVAPPPPEPPLPEPPLPAPEPVAESEPPPAPPREVRASQPTVEWDVAAELEAEVAPLATEPEPPPAVEPDDLLEETPEFLQETPQHDRLWFEQQPPRDFDFDR